MKVGLCRFLRLIVITACGICDLQAGVGTEPYLGWSFVEEGDVVVLGGTYKWSGMLFHYNASGGGTSQKPGSGIWEIPSYSYNGKPLVAIRDYSFEYWDGVEGFIIPSTVTNLSPLAFCGELIEGQRLAIGLV